MAVRNLFVLGLDEGNRELLGHVLEPDERLHELLGHDEIRGVQRFPFGTLVDTTMQRLRAVDGPIDAVTTLLDFPATELVPVLVGELGLPGPTLEAVLRCNHKYWSRLVQREAAPANVPPFAAFDPWDPAAFDGLGFDPPMWVKPLNAYRSSLGFRVTDRGDFDAAAAAFRDELGKLAEPLAEVLERADLPEEIRALGSGVCLAEGLIGGRQCTLEGYVHNGQPEVYGIVDSVRSPNRSSFSRYQYPSTLPSRLKRLMSEVARKVMVGAGMDDTPFNMEFFVDRRRGNVWLLEINPRISQSHCELFERVDGQSHHRVMLDVAQGRRPDPPHRQGRDRWAAKFFVRAWSDAVVTHVPDRGRIDEIEQLAGGANIHMEVREGDRLSELEDQEAYSFELATIFLGADSPSGLRQRFQQIVAMLDLGLEAV